MHLPDGVLDAKIWASLDVVTAGAVGVAIRKVSRKVDQRQIPMMGVMAAFIFAAQLMNIPTPGGPPVHLVGAVLAAILLGPWEAVVVMTAVMSVQALLLQDGGLLALGANVFNIGIVGTFAGYYIYRGWRRLVSGDRGIVSGAFVASWLAILLSTGFVAAEMIASGATPARIVLPVLGITNLFVGAIEGLIVAGIVGFVLRVRRDLVYDAKP